MNEHTHPATLAGKSRHPCWQELHASWQPTVEYVTDYACTLNRPPTTHTQLIPPPNPPTHPPPPTPHCRQELRASWKPTVEYVIDYAYTQGVERPAAPVLPEEFLGKPHAYLKQLNHGRLPYHQSERGREGKREWVWWGRGLLCVAEPMRRPCLPQAAQPLPSHHSESGGVLEGAPCPVCQHCLQRPTRTALLL